LQTILHVVVIEVVAGFLAAVDMGNLVGVESTSQMTGHLVRT